MRIHLYSISILLFLLLGQLHSKNNVKREDGEWRFLLAQNGVKFFWREDPSWHFLELKAENSTISHVSYSYNYSVYEGNSLAYSGKNQWFRLRPNDKNIIKTTKEFSGITLVKLEDIKVERYR